MEKSEKYGSTEQVEEKPEPKPKVHLLREGDRITIGQVVFKLQKIRPDLTLVLKPVGKCNAN